MIKEFKGFILFGFENFFKSIISIISFYLIIKNLTPEDYGDYSLSITIYTIFFSIGSLGLDPILFKRLVQKKKSKILEESFIIRILVSFILLAFSLLSAIFFQNNIIILLLILLISLIPLSFNGLRELEFSNKNYKRIVLANVFGYIIQIIGLFLIISQDLNIIWYALPILLNKTIYILTLIFFNLDVFYKYFKKTKKTPLNLNLISSGFPILASSMIGLIYAVQDQWLIKAYYSSTEVGVFSAGIRFILYLLIIPTVISNLLYQRIGKKVNSKKIDKRVLKSLYSFIFYLMTLIIITSLIIANSTFSIVFPIDFIESIKVFNIYIFIMITSGLQSLNNKLLVLDNLKSIIFYRSSYALITNLLFNLILIPRYGIIGAAISTIISEYLVLISYSFTKKTRYIFKLQIQSLNILNLKYFFK